MAKNLITREEDYSKWYNDLVVKSGLAENSSVRGCMVIKPYGYAIWEKMQAQLDKMFKETGHQNAYFPLFVPKSLFEAEEKNAEGFAKECAIVTHYRLETDPDNPKKLRSFTSSYTFIYIFNNRFNICYAFQDVMSSGFFKYIFCFSYSFFDFIF